jgi:multiple sugar transport system ATP-binding protein
MNFLPARLEGERVLAEDDAELGKMRTARSEGAVLAGVRPEDFVLSERGLAAHVALVEPTGSETHVTFRTEKTGAALVMSTRDRIGLALGQQVRLTAAPDKLHLFDASTEARLPPPGAG